MLKLSTMFWSHHPKNLETKMLKFACMKGKRILKRNAALIYLHENNLV